MEPLMDYIGSTTTTHRTNIGDFAAEQIGRFRETTGDIVDVYSHPIGMEYPANAICRPIPLPSIVR
jgi:hypothetical protein